MLAEFIQRIVDLADQARKPDVLHVPFADKTFLVKGDGELVEMERAPGIVRANVYDLDSFARWLDPSETLVGQVYVGVEEIIAILNVEDTRSRLRLPMPADDGWAYLASGRMSGTGSELLRKFRFAWDCTGWDVIAPLLKDVTFTRSTSAGEKVGDDTSDTLGLLTTDAVEGPDGRQNRWSSFPLTLARSRLGGLTELTTAAIECGVDFDYSSKTLSVLPLAGEIQKAEVAITERIVAALREKLPTVPVFSGTP